MKPIPGTLQEGGAAFAPTHWSAVLLSAESQAPPAAAERALTDLCHAYWPPLYSFVRRRGYSPADAQDLTQGFFAYLLEHKAYARADPAKGKFRTFLLGSLKNFLANAYDREQTLKRGGGKVLALDDELVAAEAHALAQSSAPGIGGGGVGELSEDRLFESRWAATLVKRAHEALRTGVVAEGKAALFDALEPFLIGGIAPLPDQEEVAARLGMPPATLRTHIHRLRARYRDLLRAEVARTVATPAEIDGELRYLYRVLSSQAAGD